MSFKKKASPNNLTLIHSTGIGDTEETGLGYLAYKDLIKRDIGGHWGMAPKMAELAVNNHIEAYNFPQGVLSQLFREIASGRPGLITKTGLRTFIDPRIEGGKLNSVTNEDIVELIEFKGEEYLFYPSIKIDVAFIRGTTADKNGNITMEKEGAFLENLSIAQSAHNNGGIVIAQVERIAQTGSLLPQEVKVPGIVVDYVVLDSNQKQTCMTKYNPGFSGEIRVPVEELSPMPLNYRKVVARRAAQEIKNDCVINLGVGMADGIASVAAEEGIDDQFTFAIEQGLVGGIPAMGVEFGASLNPQAVIGQPEQFDFFDGGGIDVAFLGAAQIDKYGNVNVSKFGSRIAGCGGFINISQNAEKLVFCCSFSAKGLKAKIKEGLIEVVEEGKIKKFVNEVEQITFNGKYSMEKGQEVLYVTERGVFKLTKEGLMLIEIAPGIDLQKDIIEIMEFKPSVSEELEKMNYSYFKHDLMGFNFKN